MLPAASENLNKLFSPKSIAVIGASRNKRKLGYITVRNIIDAGFEGTVYPVNPKADKILNLPCYKSVKDLPEIPDLAVISLPAELVLETLKELNEKKAKNVVVYSAGFKEVGSDGSKLEKEVIRFAKNNSINLLGPNCLGFANTIDKINVTFGKVVKTPGNLKLISQSGAIAASLFDWFEHAGIGFSDFVTLGNKATINENTILSYWLDYKHVDKHLDNSVIFSKYQPIGLYLESIVDGQKFLDLASQITPYNPMFILKPGKSASAKKAMQSHTGAIAGEDTVLNVALEHAGIIRCFGMEDMFDLARSFAWMEAPSGSNVAIVSNAGGPAVISADLVSEAGLNLIQLSEETKKTLETHLPRAASLLNPVDVLGDALADRYKYALEAVLSENDVNAVIVLLTPQIMTEIQETAEVIGDLAGKYQKPILCAFIGGTDVQKGIEVLNTFRIPSFHFPERAVRTLAKMWWWQNWTNTHAEDVGSFIKPQPNEYVSKATESVLTKAIERNRKVLNSFEANDILNIVDINTPPTREVKTLEDAKDFVSAEGYPVVLKLSSPLILHKKDIGGVITNINDENALVENFSAINSTLNSLAKEFKQNTRVQIQKQVAAGIEVIAGIKKDSSFGHVLMFGAGGTLAELIEDRNLCLIPVSNVAAQRLVAQSKIGKMLEGYRGDKPYNLEGLYSLLEKLSNLAVSVPDLQEFEINPIIITHENIWAVDGKGVL
ncbi:MAG: acetate--CoA ligase family protein [Patescibacteria group bacterium]